MDILSLLTAIWFLIAGVVVVASIREAVIGWRQRQERRRLNREAPDYLDALLDRLALAERGRESPPAYPSDVTIRQVFGVACPDDKEDGDEPYPRWEQEFDAIVLAATERGEW